MLFLSYKRSRKNGNAKTVGSLERAEKPNSNPTEILFFLYKARMMAEVRKRIEDTCSMYHEEPTAAVNQKQVPNPNKATSHKSLLPFTPVFLSMSHVNATPTLASPIDMRLWSKPVPKTATKGTKRTAGMGG